MLNASTRKILADNNWGPGTILIGRESGETWWGEAVIMITYVSEQTLLAVTLARRGHDRTEWRADDYEGSWDLTCRAWRQVTADDVNAIGLRDLLTEIADETPVLASLAGLAVRRVKDGDSVTMDELAMLRFEIEMSDSYLKWLWETVFGKGTPMPTAAESFIVGPRRTALKRLVGMCSRVEWPHLAAETATVEIDAEAAPLRQDLPLGVIVEVDRG